MSITIPQAIADLTELHGSARDLTRKDWELLLSTIALLQSLTAPADAEVEAALAFIDGSLTPEQAYILDGVSVNLDAAAIKDKGAKATEHFRPDSCRHILARALRAERVMRLDRDRHLYNLYQDQCENAFVEVSAYDALRQALSEVAPDHPALKGAPPAFGVWTQQRKQITALQSQLEEARNAIADWRDTDGKSEHILVYRDKFTALRERVRLLEEQKNGAYSERNKLVAALSKFFPASIEKHVGENWDDDWRNVIFIDLPTGQASWHIHDSELFMFTHLKSSGRTWDGHSTDEKYHRLAALAPAPSENAAGTAEVVPDGKGGSMKVWSDGKESQEDHRAAPGKGGEKL